MFFQEEKKIQKIQHITVFSVVDQIRTSIKKIKKTTLNKTKHLIYLFIYLFIYFLGTFCHLCLLYFYWRIKKEF
jgi:hypothetical protein